MKVLIIEDERGIIDAINVALEFRWPDAKLVAGNTGKKGVELVRKESPDIIILDLNLPDFSGFDVLKQIREFSAVPVIILTVRSDDEDVLKGLEAGADDYITKPFNYMTLLARVRAVLRRAETLPFKGKHDNTINARLKIDFVNQKVKVDNRLVKLTPVEYKLLVLLATNHDQIIPYEKIMDEVWGKGYSGETDNIRICIRRLRKKLQDIPPNLIINKRSLGYMLKN
ncbi:MAG: response regulator transcription factor [Dehalococcoidales bacterium]|jgi:two-component system KDP operon response regulator KdpE